MRDDSASNLSFAPAVPSPRSDGPASYGIAVPSKSRDASRGLESRLSAGILGGWSKKSRDSSRAATPRGEKSTAMSPRREASTPREQMDRGISPARHGPAVMGKINEKYGEVQVGGDLMSKPAERKKSKVWFKK
mmetsp:Transcript_13956/g.35617  ORF Transcript_13956/g.35617 Transcript_13956/m.35617 type:complete len:134 (+) Transcript_13956:138-539(+)